MWKYRNVTELIDCRSFSWSVCLCVCLLQSNLKWSSVSESWQYHWCSLSSSFQYCDLRVSCELDVCSLNSQPLKRFLYLLRLEQVATWQTCCLHWRHGHCVVTDWCLHSLETSVIKLKLWHSVRNDLNLWLIAFSIIWPKVTKLQPFKTKLH